MKSVNNTFSPEFINRIDEVVVFHSLNAEQIREIAKIQIKRIAKRLSEHDYQLEVDDKAVDFIAEHGFDPVYGARPLKRALQQYFENPLAEKILKGDFEPGDTIHVKCGKGDLSFH